MVQDPLHPLGKASAFVPPRHFLGSTQALYDLPAGCNGSFIPLAMDIHILLSFTHPLHA